MPRISIRKCPRCEERSLETFSTHQYCSSCNYGSAGDRLEPSVPQWAFDALKSAAIARAAQPPAQDEAPVAI